MNLWHDVPLGNTSPEEINIIVEIPKGSNNKYEIDKDTGLMALDRANYSAAAYPCEYAFVPQTYAEDGDAMDALLLSSFPISPGILVRSRVVAFMEMIDTGEIDPKVICVPVKDKRWENVKDLEDINPHTLKELKHFFETYKELKGDKVEVPGFKNKAAALEAIKKSADAYTQKFGKK